MRLGLNMGYSGSALRINVPLVQEADRLGFHSVWSAEAYGSDAVTTLTWVAALTKQIHVGTAIMQIPARTPTLTATTAITLDQLSGGRFLLGLGVSGPQVVEGWHGVPFGKPLARTREYVEIVRSVWRREKPVEFKGQYYQIPYVGADATGLGKPLKSILHGRPDIPSTSRPSAPRTSPSPRRSPTAGCPSSSRRSASMCFGARSTRALRAREVGSRSPSSTSRPPCPWWLGTTWRLVAPPSSPASPSTWGAWERGDGTSTTISSAAMATRRRPGASRTSISRGKRTRRRPRCPMPSWTRSRCAAPRSGSARGSRSGRRRA